jgi:phytoene synthase
MELDRQDLAACQAILQEGSKSFTAASRILPRRVRQPAAAVYAFCRTSDDAVDLEGSRADAVEQLRERLDRIYRDAPADHPVERSFAAVVSHFRIPRAVPEALIEGFEWDQQGRSYETISDVRAYSARVASTVGVMMTLLMGPRQAHLLARACDLGVAMQLTNIARDVGEDALQGRLYLPRSWMDEAGLDPNGFLAAPAFSEALGSVVRRLLAEAARLYERADRGIALLPRDCRASIRAARLVYADIGRVIEENGFDSISRRAYTGKLRKLQLVLRAWRGRDAAPPRDEAAEAPPLDETRFLVEAVAQQERTAEARAEPEAGQAPPPASPAVSQEDAG